MLRERWAADGDERAVGGQEALQGEQFTTLVSRVVMRARRCACFFCRPKSAPGERHTPCHDVIQGTCRIRRSGT